MEITHPVCCPRRTRKEEGSDQFTVAMTLSPNRWHLSCEPTHEVIIQKGRPQQRNDITLLYSAVHTPKKNVPRCSPPQIPAKVFSSKFMP